MIGNSGTTRQLSTCLCIGIQCDGDQQYTTCDHEANGGGQRQQSRPDVNMFITPFLFIPFQYQAGTKKWFWKLSLLIEPYYALSLLAF